MLVLSLFHSLVIVSTVSCVDVGAHSDGSVCFTLVFFWCVVWAGECPYVRSEWCYGSVLMSFVEDVDVDVDVVIDVSLGDGVVVGLVDGVVLLSVDSVWSTVVPELGLPVDWAFVVLEALPVSPSVG